MYLPIHNCVSLGMHASVCVCPSICTYVNVHSASSEWVTQTLRWHLWGCYDVCGDSGEGE